MPGIACWLQRRLLHLFFNSDYLTLLINCISFISFAYHFFFVFISRSIKLSVFSLQHQSFQTIWANSFPVFIMQSNCKFLVYLHFRIINFTGGINEFQLNEFNFNSVNFKTSALPDNPVGNIENNAALIN